MIMAEFEIEGQTSRQKCVVLLVKDNDGNLKWRKDPNTYSGVLRIGAKSGVWIYWPETKVVGLFKGSDLDYHNTKLLIGGVPGNFFECGAKYSGDRGGIALPDGMPGLKEKIYWELVGVYC